MFSGIRRQVERGLPLCTVENIRLKNAVTDKKKQKYEDSNL